MIVALGVTTCNRPEFCEKTLKAIRKHLLPVVGRVYVHDDGSDPRHHGAYQRAFKALPEAVIQSSPVNEGVAASKNHLLHAMFRDGADWLFLLEDDVRPVDVRAVTGYLDAAEKSGLEHLMFAHHGPANNVAAVPDGPVSYFPHAVGAWCLYSRRSLEAVGFFDENFVNAWEHVEHSLRLAVAGFTTGPYRWADATGSEAWLAEIPGSIEKSAIRPRPDWQRNIREGLAYWRAEKRETFDMIFGPGTPLEGYAAQILGERV